MRSYVLIFSTIGLLGGLFLIYWRNQPAAPPKPEINHELISQVAGTQPSDRFGQIGAGGRPWVKEFDAEGRLASEYRAEKYLPQKDGTVQLIAPEADFFLGHGERLHVTGKTGEAVMKSTGGSGAKSASPVTAGAPSRGRLNDVVMQLIDASAPGESAKTIITIKTNNIAFDNESFLITTEGYDEPNGTEVAADQVPVEMRGEYEFDGRGLTVRWNDRDGRLELLEIAHGDQLRILHPGGSGAGGGKRTGGTPSGSAAQGPGAQVAQSGPVASSAVATASDAAKPVVPAATVSVATTNATAPVSRPIYLATFQEAVRVTQGNQTLITGDTMRLHFRQKDQAAAQKSVTPEASAGRQGSAVGVQGPVNAGATSPLEPSKPAPNSVAGAEVGVHGSANGSTSSPSADSRPSTTDPNDLPIVVRWMGKLRIVPEASAPRELGEGESIIELIGVKSPVYVHRSPTEDAPASKVRCARLQYFTHDGSVCLNGSEELGRVELTREAMALGGEDQSGPTVVTADSVDYSGTARTATLGGVGHAMMPMADRNNPGTPAIMEANWSRQAELAFGPSAGPGSGHDLSLRRADLSGDVDVRRPQMALQSQELALVFGPTQAPVPLTEADGGTMERPAAAKVGAGQDANSLSEVTATRDVHCALSDSTGKKQAIDAQRLDLHMDHDRAGRLLARQVDADGNVHASDGLQHLFCQTLKVLLRPARQNRSATAQKEVGAGAEAQASNVELERLDARKQVKVISKEKATATSEQLLVLMEGDQAHVTLTGASLSRLEDAKHNLLSGQVIVMEPAKQLARVVGPGTLHLVSAAVVSGAGETKSAVVTPVASGGNAAGRTTDVIWSNEAVLNGIANAIDLRGKVVATMPDPDGTINTADCDHLHIDLQAKPATAAAMVGPNPETPNATPIAPVIPAPPEVPTAGPRSADAKNPVQMDLMRDKEASRLTLDEHAVIHSRLVDANGALLREMELKAPKIVYGLVATKDLAARTLLVPSAGVMLVRDYRQPEVRAGNKPDAGRDPGGLAGGRGDTAFTWSGQLIYSEADRRAVMSRDVMVVHQSDDARELPVQIVADEMTCLFEKLGVAALGTAAPASKAMRLLSLDAVGNVVVKRGLVQVSSRRIYYEPASHWMTAQGTERVPVTVDENGAQSTYDQVQWNTETWNFRLKEVGGQARRR